MHIFITILTCSCFMPCCNVGLHLSKLELFKVSCVLQSHLRVHQAFFTGA